MTTTLTTQQVTTPDGRVLDTVHAGTSGTAVLFHHGTPGSSETWAPFVDAAVGSGRRWVSFSRPGYGASTRRVGRSVADNCDDVTAVLDALEVDRFVAAGWSGGGPHALACGARLAPRCAGVLTLAGVAPLDVMTAAGQDWSAGMAPENLQEFDLARQGEQALQAWLTDLRPHFVDVTGEHIVDSLGGLVDAPDKAVLTGAFADHMAVLFREALRVGVDGWLDDDLAFMRGWGFALEDVVTPVSLWQGEQDRMVPYAHGPFQTDRLRDVRTHLLPDDGHLSIPLARLDEVFADIDAMLDHPAG